MILLNLRLVKRNAVFSVQKRAFLFRITCCYEGTNILIIRTIRRVNNKTVIHSFFALTDLRRAILVCRKI